MALRIPAALVVGLAALDLGFSCASAAPGSGWENHPGYRVQPLTVAPDKRVGFTAVDPAHSHVWFTNVLSDAALAKDSSLLSGSGVALGDVNGDGLCDIYFCSLAGKNVLYRNLGNWRFEDITEAAGVACPGQISRGAVFADLNGDGALDLLVTARGGGTRCFLNDGKGHFHDVTPTSGLATNTGSLSMALADVDGNGTLDLFVANFGVGSVLRDGGRIAVRMENGQPVVVGRHSKRIRNVGGKLVEFGEPSELYLNDGQGHFTAMSWAKGAFLDEQGKPAEQPWDYSLAVQMRDLNGDGWPDIYVCNDFFTPDRIWINDGRGHFRALPALAIRKTPLASMGVDFADIDRDGHVDGLVVEMLARDPSLRLRKATPDLPEPPVVGLRETRPQTGRNVLLWNRGDGTYADIAQYAGLAASDWSWMPLFLDVDLDGFEDVLVVNGETHDLQHLDTMTRSRMGDARANRGGAALFPRNETPNCAFRNLGNRTFEECGQRWGFDSQRACTSMAMADLDNDGGLDLVVNCLNAGALLYRNVTSAPRIAVRLKGLGPNTQGIGATITVRGGAVPFQSQEVISGGRYLAGDDPMRVFAAGTLTNRLTLEVAWRSGRHSRIEDARPNCLYEVDESSASVPPSASPVAATQPWFEDLSPLLGHTHHEEPFADSERQPSLPKRLSQPGPAVAWYDLQDQGRDDLVIGSGRGGFWSCFRWDGKGRFDPVPCEPRREVADDSAGLAAGFFNGARALLFGISGYEQSRAAAVGLLRASGSSNLTPQGLAGLDFTHLRPAAIGPLATGDLDGDGKLEVFVGGRVIPGHYPEAAPSYILRQPDAGLVIDQALSSTLAHVGLVNGAIFSDLDGDGRPELVLACEWGPIRVFHYANGRLEELTAQLGLDRFTGLWQSVNAGDLDGDGRMDLVVGNWGLNSSYHVDATHPFVAYYGDFNGDGGLQILETTYDVTGTRLLSKQSWQLLAQALPFLLETIPNNDTFSRMSVQEILGPRFGKVRKVEASTLTSMLFLNRDGKFEPAPLPPEAQWAPVFGISICDFDGDGLEDVFLAQNFFDLPAESLRLDAGRGLLLQGIGQGRLRAVSGQESGIRVYGEQRGCACGDYDGDGRVDLVVSQNGAATCLFHNLRAKPGLRVRLRGPGDNPDAIGAVIRSSNGGKLGPARELHGGSGYWSQDSLISVVSTSSESSELWVRWVGGKTTRFAIPNGAREIEVSFDRALKLVR